MSSRPELRLDWCTNEAAKYAVENWHYSKCMPAGKLVKVGVWEQGEYNGCLLFGMGANNNLPKVYNLQCTEICELVRIALRYHISPVSRLVRISLKMLKKSNPGIRLVVSYADPKQSHHGGVYQAGGWIFDGTQSKQTEYIYKGVQTHGRSVIASRGTIKGLPKITVPGKHRYLMPLDDEMRKQIEPLRKPYPKRVRSEVSGTIGNQPIGGGATPTRTLIDSVQARRSAGNADTSTT